MGVFAPLAGGVLMLKGFEEQTQSLNDKEMELADILVKIFVGLHKKYYEQKGLEGTIINSGQLIVFLKQQYNISISGARMRKIINYIRLNDMVPMLAASSNGYYICPDYDKQIEYVQSLNGRIEAIMAMRNAFMKQCNLKSSDIPSNKS